MIRTFQSKDRVEAIEFADVDQKTLQGLISLTGMGISVDYRKDGTVNSVTLRDGDRAIVALPGQFVYKTSTGTVGVCNYEYLVENYKEITDTGTAK